MRNSTNIIICLLSLVLFSSTLSGQKTTGMYGTYTICTTGCHYPSFNDAVQDLKSLGVLGPVLFKVLDGTYTEQISIPKIAGASIDNCIIFQSINQDNSTVKLQWQPTEKKNNFLLKWDGCSHVYFRYLTLERAGETKESVLCIKHKAANNELVECKIISDCGLTKLRIEEQGH